MNQFGVCKSMFFINHTNAIQLRYHPNILLYLPPTRCHNVRPICSADMQLYRINLTAFDLAPSDANLILKLDEPHCEIFCFLTAPPTASPGSQVEVASRRADPADSQQS